MELDFEYPDLTSDFVRSDSFNILGLDLSVGLIRYFSLVDELLKRGGSVKVVLCKPEKSILETLAYRSFITREPKLIGDSIIRTLLFATKLSEVAWSEKDFQIRVIPYVTPFGIANFRSISKDDIAYVKQMPFRVKTGQYPVLRIARQTHPSWYEFYEEQFDKIWDASEIYMPQTT